MIKKTPALILLLFLALLMQTANAQTAFDSLDINNINARFYSAGDMFWDMTSDPKFEAPQTNSPVKRHTMFAAGLWVGGLDQGGSLHVAAQTYRQAGLDYWSGPTDPAASNTTNYDTIWTITRSEVNAFALEYSTNGSIINPGLYPNVYAWPGNYEDANNTTQPLAPFQDQNLNQIYEPDSGDYPKMEGDKMLYWVFNDAANTHGETGGDQLGIEVHAFAYAYDCPANPALDNTILLKYQIKNKSSNVYADTYIGMYSDIDIGLFSDDYVGVDTTRGVYFGYNGDADDETANGYGLNPPAQGITMLKGPLDDLGNGMDKYTNFVYYENDFTSRGNPTQPHHFYSYMKSIWQDSLAMVNNGTTGHPQNGAGPVTTYMFSGDGGWCGGQASGWSEVSASNNPFDRRGLGSVGPFTMGVGEVNEVVYAFTYARGNYNDNLGSVCELMTSIDSLRSFFDNGSESPCAGNPTSTNNDVWPGDCNSDNVANVYDVLAIGYANGTLGVPRPNATLNWTGQPATNWGDTLPNYGTDFKHIDCDGDSLIDTLDGMAILQNYGYTHNKGHLIAAGAQMLTVTILEDSLMAGDTCHILVSLGDSVNPMDSLYGVALSIQYDPDLVDPSGVWVDYSDSWLGTRGSDLYALDKNLHFRGQLDLGLTRIDHLNANGHGNLAMINVVTIDNISGKDEILAKTLGFQITDAQAVTRRLEDLEIAYGSDSLIVYQEGSFRPQTPAAHRLRIYPNPANNQVRIETETGVLQEVKLINLLGQSLYREMASGTEQTLRLEQLPAGAYLLEVRTTVGVSRERLIIKH